MKNNTQEWYDDEIQQAIKKQDKCFNNFKKSKLYDDKTQYKKARNHVQSLIKRKKRQYIVGKLEDNVGKSKELWKTLKSLGLSKRPKTASKICLETNNVLSFDGKTNAETFKEFYANLASDLVNKLPPAAKRFGMDSVKRYYKKI